MNVFNTIILAIVQGLTEYLPISSTAHLLVTQKLLNIQPSVLFTVVLQLGTIVASIFYFRKKIFLILKSSFTNIKSGNYKNDFGLWILVGIIPVLAIGYLVNDYLDKLYNQTIIIVFTTIFFGFVFYFIELLYKKNKTKKTLETLTIKEVFYIGCAQVLSLIPGVSRSGSTIAGGLAQNIDFKDAIEVSFLMSIPVMLAATGFELIKSLKLFTPELALHLGLGVVVAFFAGLVSIRLTLGFLRKRGFLPFLIYRVIFACFILLVLVK